MSNSLIKVNSKEEFDSILSQSNKLIVLHFWVEWAQQCQQIDDVLIELTKNKDLDSVIFAKIEAESFEDISKKYNISSAPTCVLFVNKKVIGTVEGADVSLLTKQIKQSAFKVTPLVASPSSLVNDKPLDHTEQLKSLINKAPIMVFMKGNRETPRCGFSRTLIGILNDMNVKYETFDILSDDDVRQNLKIFSNWPTYPQLYVKGNLIGGLDIVKELQETGELEDALKL